MKIQQSKKQLLLFYMAGFFAGILYANFSVKDYVAVTGIFNEYFLNEYMQMKIIPADYIWYLFRIRVVPFLMLGICALTRLKKLAVIVFLTWTGFLGGIVSVTGLLRMGVKGIILCVAGMMPHFLFYIPVYVVILWYLYTYPSIRWNMTKTIFVLLAFAVGMITEGYVNPIFMKIIIKTL